MHSSTTLVDVSAKPKRTAEIEALFSPLDVRAFSCPATEAFIHELRPEEKSSVAAMAAGRQAEFATARACAHSALAELGRDAAVPRQDGGAPLWPEGVAGSISHTRGFCVAVVGKGEFTLGIDAEEAGRMRPAIERRILVPAEQSLADTLEGSKRSEYVATVFAAKEAFYKAHYEIDARYLGFDAVTVDVVADTVAFTPASGAVDAAVLARSTGRVVHAGPRVIVGVVLRRQASE